MKVPAKKSAALQNIEQWNGNEQWATENEPCADGLRLLRFFFWSLKY